jgi:superfamily II DNA or RNA helicase
MKVQVDSWAWLPTASLTHMQVSAVKAALTVMPRKFEGFPGEAPQPIRLYTEREGYLGVPRSYFMEHKKEHHVIEDLTTLGRSDLWAGPLKFDGSLRETQKAAVATVTRAFKDEGQYGGLLRAPPGFGKTVVSCAIMAELGVPTLVVVHKDFLVSQWKERIEQFLPGTKVGIVQQDRCEYKDYGVVIGMIHSLVGGRDYGADFWGWPGLIITDETHRIGAETWSVVPTRFKARWRLGVSATPRRKDGAEAVFFQHIGKVLFSAEEQRMTPKIRRVWTDFKLVQTPTLNPQLVSKNVLLKFMCGNAARNRLITEQLVMAVAAGRKPIVLSERLQHLDVLDAMFKKEWATKQTAPVPSTGFYVGGMKEEELEEASKAQVVFATRQFAEEGLDIPALDTLFLTTPISDVEQACGRVLRPCEGKKEPVIVDFRDDKVQSCEKTATYRDKFYAARRW